MPVFKNIIVGFIVSFLGSIPLGYLNFVGLEIYFKLGLESVVFFILGIIFVEAFVIYFTLIFANQFVNNKKLMKWIDVFGIFFLLIIAYSFYNHASDAANETSVLQHYYMYPAFCIGLFLNCLNFLQLPFWAAWNLYLINEKYIDIHGKLKFFYLLGTLLGVFTGMLTIIYILNTISYQVAFFSKYLIPVLIPLFLMILALAQFYKVYRKYFSSYDIND